MNALSPPVSDRKGPSHATVFVWLFAVSVIWHYTSSASEIIGYWMHYDPLVTPLIFLSIASAFIAAIFPGKTPALLVMSSGQLIANYFRYPVVADHLVMEIFLNLSIMLAFFHLAIRRRIFRISTTEIFDVFSPVGRWLLMTIRIGRISCCRFVCVSKIPAMSLQIGAGISCFTNGKVDCTARFSGQRAHQ